MNNVIQLKVFPGRKSSFADICEKHNLESLEIQYVRGSGYSAWACTKEGVYKFGSGNTVESAVAEALE